jgi:hypothetical protein
MCTIRIRFGQVPLGALSAFGAGVSGRSELLQLNQNTSVFSPIQAVTRRSRHYDMDNRLV